MGVKACEGIALPFGTPFDCSLSAPFYGEWVGRETESRHERGARSRPASIPTDVATQVDSEKWLEAPARVSEQQPTPNGEEPHFLRGRPKPGARVGPTPDRCGRSSRRSASQDGGARTSSGCTSYARNSFRPPPSPRLRRRVGWPCRGPSRSASLRAGRCRPRRQPTARGARPTCAGPIGRVPRLRRREDGGGGGSERSKGVPNGRRCKDRRRARPVS